MGEVADHITEEAEPLWFCVRAKTKSEHIAAAGLREIPGIEVFCPRLRERRATRRGPVWFVEALFPGYLFARFDPLLHLRTVSYANASLGVVGFGGYFPPIPDGQIIGLRNHFDEEGVHTVPDSLAAGDRARINTGPFAGLEAVIQTILPARNRVTILLDFLGSLRAVELPRHSLNGPSCVPGDFVR